MIFLENRLLAYDTHEIPYLIFLKIGKDVAKFLVCCRALRDRVRVSGSLPFDHTARVCFKVSRAYSNPGAKWPGPVSNPGEEPSTF